MSRAKQPKTQTIGAALREMNRHLADIADSLRGIHRMLEIANAIDTPPKPGTPS